MDTLNLALVEEIVNKLGENKEIKKFDNALDVRRNDNSCALNDKGDLIAVSFSGSELEELILGEEAQHLEHLYLANNEKLRSIKFAAKLDKLKHLYLNDCGLTEVQLPDNCTALEQLYVQNNQLTKLEFKGNCPKLKLLDASGNQMTQFDLQYEFGSLECLYLNNNQLKKLNISTALKALNILHLRDNQLDELPNILLQSGAMEALNLHENPLKKLGKSVLTEEGNENSWDSFKSNVKALVEDSEVDYDQVKLVVLGNSTAGKTSLVYYLKDKVYEKNRASTHGMIPLFWTVEPNLKVAVWDFGGQEYYHNTHHLLFTSRCLYLVVFVSATNCNDILPTEIEIYKDGVKVPLTENLQHFHYQYWLENIEYLTRDDQERSVFKIQNKIEEKSTQIDPTADFKISIEKANEAKLANNENEDEYGLSFKLFEKKLIKKLKEIKGTERISPKWLAIKNKIQEIALEGSIPFLRKEEFENLAEEIKPGISKLLESNKSDLDFLSKRLADSGVILFYPKIKELEGLIFINPAWLTDAIYRVLDYQVQEKGGVFNLSHVENAIAAKTVDGQKIPAVGLSSKELLALMDAFGLIFELNRALNPKYFKDNERTFIAPQYLPELPPEQRHIAKLKEEIMNDTAPSFSLIYPVFMPKSTMPRFVAKNGNFATNACWRYGIPFAANQTEVLVECDYKERTINVWVQATKHKSELCKKIFDDFNFINDKNPDILITKDQIRKIKIGNLLRHRFDKNEIIYAENGEEVQASEFQEFVENLTEIKLSHPKPSGHMYGIQEQIEGIKQVIDKDVKTLNRLKLDLAKAYDSMQKISLESNIEEIEAKIEKSRKDLQELENNLGISIESSENRTALEALSADISQISAQISDVNDKIDAGFAAVLNKLSAQDKYLINILTLSESHQNELAEFFVAFDEKEISAPELEAMTKRIDEMLGQHLLELPATLTQQWKKLNEKSAEYTDAKGKIKLKLPIIPSILEYEVETNWDLKKVAKQIWADFKAGKIFLK